MVKKLTYLLSTSILLSNLQMAHAGSYESICVPQGWSSCYEYAIYKYNPDTQNDVEIARVIASGEQNRVNLASSYGGSSAAPIRQIIPDSGLPQATSNAPIQPITNSDVTNVAESKVVDGTVVVDTKTVVALETSTARTLSTDQLQTESSTSIAVVKALSSKKSSVVINTIYPIAKLTAILTNSKGKKYTYTLLTNKNGDVNLNVGLNLRDYVLTIKKGTKQLDKIYIK